MTGMPIFEKGTVCSEELSSELAAQLLFMNVRWVKNLIPFTTLPLDDQLILLEGSWNELFVLGTAEFLLPLDLHSLAHTVLRSIPDEPAKKITILQEVEKFQEALTAFAELGPNSCEYAYLRAIVLFHVAHNNPNDEVVSIASSSSSASSSPISRDIKPLLNPIAIFNIQSQAQFALYQYLRENCLNEPSRFTKLLAALKGTKAISNTTIVELFFKRTVGDIPIERLICDMYKAESNGFSNFMNSCRNV